MAEWILSSCEAVWSRLQVSGGRRRRRRCDGGRMEGRREEGGREAAARRLYHAQYSLASIHSARLCAPVLVPGCGHVAEGGQPVSQCLRFLCFHNGGCPLLEVATCPGSQTAVSCARRSASPQRGYWIFQSHGQRDGAARRERHPQVGPSFYLRCYNCCAPYTILCMMYIGRL